MTTTAIIMMIIAIITIWGGLLLAIINLSKRGDVIESEVDLARTHRDL